MGTEYVFFDGYFGLIDGCLVILGVRFGREVVVFRVRVYVVGGRS